MILNKLKYQISMMISQKMQLIVNLFDSPLGKYKRYIRVLIKECCEMVGETETFYLLNQWRTLSLKLNTDDRLDSLKDKNHRQLLIQYIRNEAVKQYNYSYFNKAKIDNDYIQYIKQVGPFNFSQIIIIINQLRLIYKHYKDKMILKRMSESHMDMTILRILQLCKTKSRHINNNLNKFKCIIQFKENRQELIKQLGKMLRYSWALQKKYAIQINQNISSERSVSQRNFSQLLQISVNNQRCYEILNSGIQYSKYR